MFNDAYILPECKAAFRPRYTTTVSIFCPLPSAGRDKTFPDRFDETKNGRRRPQRRQRAARVFGEIVAKFSALFGELDISYDQFIRTTDKEKHWPGAQALWKKLEASGDLYKKEYEGLYCVGHEAFITEKDLVDGKCPDHGTATEFLKEENYFFRLTKYHQTIKEKIESGELQMVPKTRRNEILSA